MLALFSDCSRKDAKAFGWVPEAVRGWGWPLFLFEILGYDLEKKLGKCSFELARAKRVSADEVSAISVLQCLQALGVSLVTEWDTLAFLYSHSASLGTAAQIARLVGYEMPEIRAALQRLEELGLIRRSRASQGTRIYKLSEPEPGRQSCLLEIMSLAQNRTGRLLLLQHLLRPRQKQRRSREGGLRLA